MWLLYLIFYGAAFGTLAAMVAKGKNRDQSNWFLIGFFFGIFGFIAALVVEKKENAPVAVQPRATAPSRSRALFEPSEIDKKCPDCAERIKLEARVCRFCGYRFSDQDVRSAVADAHWNWLDAVNPAVNGNRYCNFCGQSTQSNFGEPPYIVCSECVDEQEKLTAEA